jgi:ABC-type multidrug transport system fused ATPase/permease subunit
MFDVYKKLLGLLTRRERRSFFVVLGLVLIMGFVETVGVASIVPFMLVLADPSVIERHAILGEVYHALNFTDPHAFMVFLGFVVFTVIVGGLLFKTFAFYAVYRFTMMRSYTIANRMLRGYLLQPYTWFLNRNSAEIGANILGDVSKVTTKALLPAMKVLTYGTVVVGLILLLVLVRPVVAFTAAVVLGGSYVLIYVAVRSYLLRLGHERHIANRERFQIAGEALGGIKDVKLLGLEDAFLNRYRKPALQVARHDATSTILADLPHYLLEAVAFGAMLAFVLFLLITGSGSIASIVPMLALYAFAAIRIFPALQRIYNSLAAIRFSKPTLDRLYEDMKAAEANMRTLPPRTRNEPAVRLAGRLDLEDIHYAYPLADRAALCGLSLSIPARSTIGIVGGTGAGKTTAIDIVLGLLVPDRGRLVVDGTPVTAENLAAWQRSIGYVPQQIFLTDDTVSANIAFGLDAAEIDQAAVERAAKIAEIHDFVLSEMSKGYATPVGERGVRLSGGQRQRIGIARALYHDPDVLILDEATSALDNLTEKAVMDAVHNLGHAKTIIMIAHRLSTVRDCDTIFMLEHGRVVAAGAYDDLIESNRQFRALAGA